MMKPGIDRRLNALHGSAATAWLAATFGVLAVIVPIGAMPEAAPRPPSHALAATRPPEPEQ